MDVFTIVIRGMGYSVIITIISLIGICVLRIIWLFAAFALRPILSLMGAIKLLYSIYTMNWVVTGLVFYICYKVI